MSAAFAEQSETSAPEARALLYGFLAEVFSAPPTQETQRVMGAMAAALNLSCPGEAPLDALQREFMDLFVVPNPRYVAPYESVYRDRWLLPPTQGTLTREGTAPLRLLMGESALAVRQCYLAAGVEPVSDLPDHLGNELRLLSHLWSDEARQSLGEGGRLDELRSQLRDQHLLKWIADLRRKVLEHDQLGLYSMALEVAETVLQGDAEEMEPPLAPPYSAG